LNPFVEQCIREWRRLGVPEPVANEMAAELESDLSEAQTERVSAEEVLGTAVFDATSFAAAWASERGVVPPAPRPATARRSPLLAAALAVMALLAIAAGIAILSARSGPVRVAVGPPFGVPRSVVVRPRPIPFRIVGRNGGHVFRPPFPVVPYPIPNRAVAVGVSSFDLRPVGWLLVAVGIAALVGAALSRPWSRRAA
jgi:hypothetical protein